MKNSRHVWKCSKDIINIVLPMIRRRVGVDRRDGRKKRGGINLRKKENHRIDNQNIQGLKSDWIV